MVAILHMIRFFLLLGIGLAIVPEVGAQSRRKVDAEETGSRIVGRDYERQTTPYVPGYGEIFAFRAIGQIV